MTPDFTLEVSQNEFLSVGDAEMHAVLTVTGTGSGEPGGGAVEAAEVIAIDCSGSMHYPPTKIAAAKRATAAAIDALREGVHFAVVAGTDTARVVYPGDDRLVPATAETRTAAKRAVHRVIANGGTAMGSWLRLADRLLAAHPNAVRHVILLTDGLNEHETPEELDAVLADCHGRFVCDARGIGDGWSAKELLRIVSALRGKADAVRVDAELVADFVAITRSAMDKVVPDLVLKVATAPFARVRFLKQTFPTEVDLTELSHRVNDHTILCSTGSWGAESREFHLCLDVDRTDLPLNEDHRAARVDVVVADETRGAPVAVRVHWTEDVPRSSVQDPNVIAAIRQAELGRAMMEAHDAHDAGNLGRATAKWGQAVALATKLGNEEVLARLARLVDVVGDPAAGVVRLKQNVSPGDLESAALSSVFSTRSPEPQPVAEKRAEGPNVVCSSCTRVSPPGTAICQACGNRLGATA